MEKKVRFDLSLNEEKYIGRDNDKRNVHKKSNKPSYKENKYKKHSTTSFEKSDSKRENKIDRRRGALSFKENKIQAKKNMAANKKIGTETKKLKKKDYTKIIKVERDIKSENKREKRKEGKHFDRKNVKKSKLASSEDNLKEKSVDEVSEKNDEINEKLKNIKAHKKNNKFKKNKETKKDKSETLNDSDLNLEGSPEYKVVISAIGVKEGAIKSMYKRHKSIKRVGNKYTIVYSSEEEYKKDIEIDEKYTALQNKVIVFNLSYKETEDSIKKVFSKYGKVIEIRLEKTKENVFSGKAIITFQGSVKIKDEVVMNGKILRIERIKEKKIDDKRFFISNIDKDISIVKIRSILKQAGCKPTDIRIRYNDEGRNVGYAHISYSSRDEARNFEKLFDSFKEQIGKNTKYEYSIEK